MNDLWRARDAKIARLVPDAASALRRREASVDCCVRAIDRDRFVLNEAPIEATAHQKRPYTSHRDSFRVRCPTNYIAAGKLEIAGVHAQP